MKRLFLLVITLFYFGGSTGFAMHFHYCMEQLESATLIYALEGGMENCDMENGEEEAGHEDDCDDCCKDEVKTAKTNGEQLLTELSVKLMKLWTTSLPLNLTQFASQIIVPSDVVTNPSVHAPPNTSTVPVFLRNCVFRI